jgi:hypothetical protein
VSYASDPQGTIQATTSTPAAVPLDPLDKIAMLMTIQPPGMTTEAMAWTQELIHATIAMMLPRFIAINQAVFEEVMGKAEERAKESGRRLAEETLASDPSEAWKLGYLDADSDEFSDD